MDEKVILLLIAAAVGLVGKIVWDWLKVKNNVDQSGQCTEHSDRIVVLEKCSTNIKRAVVVLETRVDQQEKELRRGDAKFSAIMDKQAEILGAVCGINARLDERALYQDRQDKK